MAPAISRVLLVWILSTSITARLLPDGLAATTITRLSDSCSQVVTAGLFQQAATSGLHRHQVTAEAVVFVALLHRRHPLQLRFDVGDPPADPDFLQPGQHADDVAGQPLVVGVD